MTLDHVNDDDYVIGDNLNYHFKGWSGAVAQAAYRAVGAKYVRLPTYSPEFNPSELVFSYLKAKLRNNYTVHDDLLLAMNEILGSVKLRHMIGWYTRCGWLW